MVLYDTFEANVLIGDVAIAEYDDPDDPDNPDGPDETVRDGDVWPALPSPAIKRFIEADEGRHFELKVCLRPGYSLPEQSNSLLWELCLDGQYIQGCVFDKVNCTKPEGSSYCFEGKRSVDSSGACLERFKFGKLTLDDNTRMLMNDLDKLGTIEIKVWQYHRDGIQENPVFGSAFTEKTATEKALKGKAITLVAGLAQKEPASAIICCHGSKVGRHPLVTFMFKYRSRKSLQDLMVIERPRTPTPLEERDPETLTAPELRELLRRKRAETADRTQAKPESKRAVKREHEVLLSDDDDIQIVKRPRELGEPIEVIDIDSD